MSDIISINPATGEGLSRVPITPTFDIAHHVATARLAQRAWARTTFKERAAYLLRARAHLLANIDAYATTISQENGKPMVEAVTAEIYPVAELIYYFAHHTERLLKSYRQPIGILGSLMRSSRIEYTPVGVVGIISPWNYPFSIPAGECAMALMAGNAVLLKPSSITALVGTRIAEMFEAAGLPFGIFTHLAGNAATGQALIDARPDKLLFTGSVEIGKKIMASCAKNLTPVVLELGGKDPMIVRADADIDHASSGAVWGAFTNCGQTCAAVERVYVHKDIHDEFVAAVVAKTQQLTVGVGTEQSTDIGPLTTESQRATVEAQVEDARTRGGRIECGGARPPNLAGYFYAPTVITNVTHDFACMRDETFGPLLPIMSFTDDDDAVRLANDCAFGLTASVWTKDIIAGRALARRIEAGTVTVNECVYTHALCQTPWGGVKDSGFGRSHSRFGLMELVHPHHIHVNRWCKKSMWWYGYSAALYRGFRNLARHLTGGWVDKIKALPWFGRVFLMRKR